MTRNSSDKPSSTMPRDRNTDAAVRLAADALEEEIVLGSLHPRERLVEDDLCERFSLKRHVARRVLSTLEQRGIIECRKHFGASVKAYSAQEVYDLYAVREILETSAAKLISLPVAAERMEVLAEIQKQHDEAAKCGDHRAVFRANVLFHHALFALSENAALVELIREYERRTYPIRWGSMFISNYPEKARREHHKLISALRGTDQQCLIELCRVHLIPARDAYLQLHHRQTGKLGLPQRQ